MGFLDRLATFSPQYDEARKRKAEDLAMQQANEDRATNKLSLKDIANQVGDTELRKRVGLANGPMTEDQTGLSAAISQNLMDNPDKLAMEIPASQALKYNSVLDMLAAMKKGSSDLNESVISEEDALKNGFVKKGTRIIRGRGPTDPTVASGLRKEFIGRPELKEFTDVDTQVRSMDGLMKQALSGNAKSKAFIDQGLLTTFNKIIDPISVVRESEYARSIGGSPFVNKVAGALAKLQEGGEGLLDEDRIALVTAAKIIANQRGATYRTTRKNYSDISGKYGVDPSLVVGSYPDFTDYQIGDAAQQYPASGLSKEEQDEMAQLEAELSALGAK